MAILNKIRQRSLFLILVIAMALFSFVLADLFKNTDNFSSKSQTVIATINGEDIKRDDFMAKVEAAQQQFAGSLTSTQAMNRVWDQEVNSTLLEAQYNALGISVERDQMRDLLQLGLSNFEEFKNEDGLYDENKLNEFIANLKAISPETALLGGSPINYEAWTNYENDMAATGKQQTYFNMVKAGLFGTLAEGEIDYKLENDKVDFKYVKIPFSSIPDSTITVTQSDISKYVKEHKAQYQVDESRDIRFVEFKEEASLEDETAIKDELIKLLEDREEYVEASQNTETVIGFKNTTDDEAFLSQNSALKLFDDYMFKANLPVEHADSIWNLNKGELYGPYKNGNMFMITKIIDTKQIADSVKVRHILIPFAGAMQAAPDVVKTDEQAKATADSILNVVKSNRSKFQDLLELSSDVVSNQNNGEIEFAYTAGMAPEFKAFSFDNSVGALDVVKTDFGYHVVEILSQGDKQRAIKIGNLAREIEPSDDTVDRVFNETSKFEIAVATRDFNEVANESDYTVKPVSAVKALDEAIPGLGSQRAIVRWAYEDGVKVGDIKRFNVPGGYAVVQLTAINAEGLMSTDKASVTALPAIRKEKKAELIKARISGATLEDIASSESQTVQTALAVNMKTPTISGSGNESKVVGTVFGLTEGATSKPITGNSGVFVVQVTKFTPAEPLPNYQAAANRIGNAKSATVNTVLLNALKEAAEIEDNRATFY
ncbi:peptidylprolyl isomerase [Pontimicrobium aquaticum]|uniref:Periplasmic chaperone PpiD n=1 Tax=Pontimicrobium aquaticum TaxID=2565367 RepID=A0A4U0EZY9_9FLAO|nr:SurA N-terminal domain-containing protein [Pontimicrobium aquaticum]TJY37685.1 peptidylprolyl isomerase [Pontimicrobium aquaticum]